MNPDERIISARALAQHAITGERYIVEYRLDWESEPFLSQIIAAVGPLELGDLDLPEPLEPSRALFDRIDAAVNLSDEDADWLQAEEDAGRLAYPIGARVLS